MFLSRHVFKTSSRRLQRNNFSSSKTSSRRFQDVFKTSLQDVFKTSSRRLGRRKMFTLKTSSRHVLRTCWRRLQDQQMFAGDNFRKLFDQMPFWFQRQIEKLKKLGLGSQFFSISPLRPNMIRYNQICCMNVNNK